MSIAALEHYAPVLAQVRSGTDDLFRLVDELDAPALDAIGDESIVAGLASGASRELGRQLHQFRFTHDVNASALEELRTSSITFNHAAHGLAALRVDPFGALTAPSKTSLRTIRRSLTEARVAADSAELAMRSPHPDELLISARTGAPLGFARDAGESVARVGTSAAKTTKAPAASALVKRALAGSGDSWTADDRAVLTTAVKGGVEEPDDIVAAMQAARSGFGQNWKTSHMASVMAAAARSTRATEEIRPSIVAAHRALGSGFDDGHKVLVMRSALASNVGSDHIAATVAAALKKFTGKSFQPADRARLVAAHLAGGREIDDTIAMHNAIQAALPGFDYASKLRVIESAIAGTHDVDSAVSALREADDIALQASTRVERMAVAAASEPASAASRLIIGL